MNTDTPLTPDQPAAQISLDLIDDSPFQVRTSYPEASIAELAQTILDHGLQQPVLLRASDDGRYQLVFGHRRTRAARHAGLATIAAFVREMSDHQAAELLLIENAQREDVGAIEEGEGYQRLIEQHGMTVEQIMRATHRSRSHVYGRMQLAKLCPALREAVLAKEVEPTAALLVARVGPPELQVKALDDIKKKMHWARNDIGDGGKASYRAIRDFLAERYTLDLDDALFDTTSEALLPAAGPCTSCPKRSGNSPLHEDLAQQEQTLPFGRNRVGPNVCTDPACFANKKAAHLAIDAARLEQAGAVVIAGAKAKKLVDQFGRLKDQAALAPKDAVKVARQAGVKAPLPVVTIQNPQDGSTRQAVLVKDLQAAGVPAGQAKKAMPGDKERARSQAAMQQQKQAAEAESARRQAVLSSVMAKLGTTARSTEDLRAAVAVALVTMIDAREDLRAVCEAHGAVIAHLPDWPALEEVGGVLQALAPCTASQLALLLIECALRAGGIRVNRYQFTEANTLLDQFAERYGIDETGADVGPPAATPTPSKAARAARGRAGKAARANVADDLAAAGTVDVHTLPLPLPLGDESQTDGRPAAADGQADEAGCAGQHAEAEHA